MADHYQAHPSSHHHGRMTPEQRMRDPFMHHHTQMRDHFPSHFMNNAPNNGMDIQDPHLFRSPPRRTTFPSHGFDDGFGRGFSMEDHPGPMFNRRDPSAHVESIPIKVIHEKSSSGKPEHKQPQKQQPYHNHHSSPPHQFQQKHHPFSGGRKTTEIPLPSGQCEQMPSSGSPRLERAHSEPPKSFHQRMSTLIPPQIPIPERQDEDSGNPITTSASAPSVTGEPEAKQHPSQTSNSFSPPPPPPPPPSASSHEAPQIRHIPIVVEGRDAPVFSRKFSDTRPSPSQSVEPKSQPSHPAEPTTPLGPPPGPIPMGCSADHLKPNEPSSPLPRPEGPIPLPCSPNLLNDRKKKDANPVPSSKEDSTDGGVAQEEEKKVEAPLHNKEEESNKSSSSEPDPALEKVKSIQDNLAEITRRIEGFKGSKKDKEYLYLDEMLTRHLLSLDGIDSGGKEEIRKIRKESIKSVNRCLSLLDSKAGPSEK